MTPDEITTMRAAIDRYVADCAILATDTQQELTRARELRDRFAAAIQDDPHVSDERLMPEVLRPGDILRVSTALLASFDESAPSAAVQVRNITREPDGTVTITIAPIMNG